MASAGTGGDKAAPLCRADARPRSAVPRIRVEGGPSPAWPRQPCGGAAIVIRRAARTGTRHRMARVIGSRPSRARVCERTFVRWARPGAPRSGAHGRRAGRAPDRLPAARRTGSDAMDGCGCDRRREAPDSSAPAGRESDRLVGRLVHRLLERLGGETDLETVRRCATQLVRSNERFERDLGLQPENDATGVSSNQDAALQAAVAAYHAVTRREDVRLLYSWPYALHEVPFTMSADGAWLRGTIDCIVRDDSGVLTVLEFKTGRSRPEHHEQLELYRRAAEHLFPGHRVEARLVYTNPVSV